MSDKPFDLVTYLEEDLEDRRAGGEDCPTCYSDGIAVRFDGSLTRTGPQHKWVSCPDCKGTGKSPAITQAEEALKAARDAVEREKAIREWAEDDLLNDVERHAVSDRRLGRHESAVLILSILNSVTKPVTNSAESAVSGGESAGSRVTIGDLVEVSYPNGTTIIASVVQTCPGGVLVADANGMRTWKNLKRVKRYTNVESEAQGGKQS